MLIEENLKQETEKNYIVLARRTRPQSLSELVGQEVIANSIANMLVSKKIPHAFLFTGTRGTGKTSSARILAKSLCCEKGPTPSPCQTCIHCKQITACAHDDILEIDGASNTGVDNVRELNEAARFYPHSAKYKIFIIDEVHMLSTGAFNALLKTLEEPPSQVIFILATTELHKVPITVRSRCMIFSFKKIESSIIGNHLQDILKKENITFEEDAIQIIAREAKGSLRDSLSLLEQAIAICGGQHLSTQETKKGLCVQGEELAEKLFSAICKKNTGLALETLQEANIASLDIACLFENTANLFRSTMLVKSFGDKERTLRLAQLLSKEYDFLEQESKNISNTAISEIFKALSQSIREISRTTAPLAWAEMVVIDCILRADWLSASEIIALLNTQGNSIQNYTTVAKISPQKNGSEQQKNQASLSIPEIQPTKPNVTENNSELKTEALATKIDLHLFKKFVEHALKKSEVLATKLKFVRVNYFTANKIEFADTQENSTYLSLNEQDSLFFWDCIKELDLEKTQITGKYLPNKVTKSNDNKLVRKTNEIIFETKNIKVETTEPKEAAKNLLKNFQKFSNSHDPQTNHHLTKQKNLSLNEFVNEEKSKAYEEKANKILAKESLQELSKLATELEIIEI